jgi:anti-anti-sigma factor
VAERAKFPKGSAASAKLQVESHGGDLELIVLTLAGECDFDTVREIDRYLRRSCGPLYYRRHLLLDLDGVTAVDSSFVSFVVTLVRNLHGERKELIITRPKGDVRKIIGMVGLPNVVPVYDSIEEAREALRSARRPLIPPLFDSVGPRPRTSDAAGPRPRASGAAARRP